MSDVIHRIINSTLHTSDYTSIITVTKGLFDLHKYHNVNFDHFSNIYCGVDIHHA